MYKKTYETEQITISYTNYVVLYKKCFIFKEIWYYNFDKRKIRWYTNECRCKGVDKMDFLEFNIKIENEIDR